MNQRLLQSTSPPLSTGPKTPLQAAPNDPKGAAIDPRFDKIAITPVRNSVFRTATRRVFLVEITLSSSKNPQQPGFKKNACATSASGCKTKACLHTKQSCTEAITQSVRPYSLRIAAIGNNIPLPRRHRRQTRRSQRNRCFFQHHTLTINGISNRPKSTCLPIQLLDCRL